MIDYSPIDQIAVDTACRQDGIGDYWRWTRWRDRRLTSGTQGQTGVAD